MFSFEDQYGMDVQLREGDLHAVWRFLQWERAKARFLEGGRDFRVGLRLAFNLETAMEPAKYAKDTKWEGFTEMCALTLRVNG